MIHYDQYDPSDTAAWESKREAKCRFAVGGSAIATVVGINAFDSRYAMAARLLGRIPKRDNPSTNAYFDDGHDIEEIVARRFEKASGFKLRHRYAIIQNDKYPHLFADVDRLIDGADAGWEGKTFDVRSDKFRDGCPAQYVAQCIVYLAVTEKKRWYLSAWAYGQGTKHYLITLDPSDVKPEWCESVVVVDPSELQAAEDAAREFIEMIQRGELPPVDGHEETGKAIRAEHPASIDGTPDADLTPYSKDLDEISHLDEEIESLEKKREACKQEIMLAMGESERGSCGDWRVSYKTVVSKRLDSKAARAALGAALDPYMKEAATRSLRISKAK